MNLNNFKINYWLYGQPVELDPGNTNPIKIDQMFRARKKRLSHYEKETPFLSMLVKEINSEERDGVTYVNVNFQTYDEIYGIHDELNFKHTTSWYKRLFGRTFEIRVTSYNED